MEVFVARQPIFNRDRKVVAYELLFRNGFQNFFSEIDGDKASFSVLSNSFLSIGMEKLTRGKPAFINFTRKLLLDEIASLFPSRLLAIEVLETVAPEQDIIDACWKMKKNGYKIVLDDFVFNENFLPLMEFADVIKVDFMLSSIAECRQLIHQYARKNLIFLAEKVETRDVFEQALSMGYSLFQGYFFSKPEIVSGREVPGYKHTYLQMLQEIHQPDVDFAKIESILKQDVSLSYKLLKFINSAAIGIRNDIQSIHQALVLLGLQEVRKWITVISLNRMGADKPLELLIVSLIRARFCEDLAPAAGMNPCSSDLFLTGLFSTIDALIDRPMQEILSTLPLTEQIKQALLGEPTPYRHVLEMILAMEKGDWNTCFHLGKKFNLPELLINKTYLNAIDWAQQVFQMK